MKKKKTPEGVDVRERIDSAIITLGHLSRMLKASESIDEQFGRAVAMDPKVSDPVREARDIYAGNLDAAINLLKTML